MGTLYLVIYYVHFLYNYFESDIQDSHTFLWAVKVSNPIQYSEQWWVVIEPTTLLWSTLLNSNLNLETQHPRVSASQKFGYFFWSIAQNKLNYCNTIIEFLRQFASRCMLISFFETVLIILRYHTKHVQFWLGCSFPLSTKNLETIVQNDLFSQVAKGHSKVDVQEPNKHHFPPYMFLLILKLRKGQTWKVGGPSGGRTCLPKFTFLAIFPIGLHVILELHIRKFKICWNKTRKIILPKNPSGAALHPSLNSFK